METNGIDGDDTRSAADSETESASDDDMMDRISSSPSIDDGAYRSRSPVWPERSSSLTPTNMRFAASASASASAYSIQDSSPFVEEPDHLPLSATGAGDYDSSASTQQSSSPYSHLPDHLPLWIIAQKDRNMSSPYQSHHLVGEYSDNIDNDNDSDQGFYEDNFEESDISSVEESYTGSTSADFSYKSQKTPLYPAALNVSRTQFNQVDDIHLQNMTKSGISEVLLPEHDPILQAVLDTDRPDSSTSTGSWSTLSNDEIDWQDLAQDDDIGDLSFYSDERFVDSGWGGECLRETEDIDFDFVYALHTFVATVEGQANATKGDTMVLLDDSNSYWWLVRVVKDSSIGRYI